MVTLGSVEKISKVVVPMLIVIGISSALTRYILPSDMYYFVSELMFGTQFVSIQFPNYEKHHLLILIHSLPGAIYFLIAPMQFSNKIRSYKKTHRILGRVFTLCGLFICISGVFIVFKLPFSGIQEIVPIVFFAMLFAFTLARAIIYAIRRNITAHREWIIRNFSIGLGIATLRVFYIPFLLLSNMDPLTFFPIIIWLGFGINIIIAELWIRSTRPPFNKSKQIDAEKRASV